MKRFIAVILLLSMLFVLISCEKRYEYCEFGLKLSDDYKESELKDTFDKAYTNGRVVIGINRMSFDACLENGVLPTHTPRKFASIYRESVAKTDEPGEVLIDGDVPYFTYKRISDGIEYLYVSTFYSSQYAYFVVTFISPNINQTHLITEFLKIANTMYFTYDVR